MAHLLDVSYRISLLPGISNGGHRADWNSTLVSAGCDWGFKQKYDEVNERDVVNYMLFDGKTHRACAPACAQRATMRVPSAPL